jgi:protein-L-isoaspartate(D-aspartate) O-methyltransferase
MVDRDIRQRGVTDERVLEAMGTVPRERFLPEALAASAYDDRALPIEEDQTISQPYIVALMAASAELTPTSRVLEIGTGSGYGAAVLGRVAAEVWTIERHESLADTARTVLAALDLANVHVVFADGTAGLPERAPFDAIIVTAAASVVPEPLLEQLADGGRLVIPVGPDPSGQRLMRIRRDGAEFVEEALGAVRFVPLIGEHA